MFASDGAGCVFRQNSASTAKEKPIYLPREVFKDIFLS
jgi:hypothetical protein